MSGAASLVGIGCDGPGKQADDPGSPLTDSPWRWTDVADLGGTPTALTQTADGLLVAVGDDLWKSPDGLSWVVADRSGLPSGPITLLGAVDGDDRVEFAYVHGQGLYRRPADASWQAVSQPPDSTLMRSLNPRSSPVPWAITVDPSDDQRLWLAATGGLYLSEDGGDTWSTPPGLADAGFNLLFTGVAVRGQEVAATAFRPAGVLPDAYAGLLTAGIFRSSDGGQTWRDGDPDLLMRYPTDVALDPTGVAWVSTQDGGVWKETDDGWENIGGPDDAMAIEWSRGGLNVASGRRGIWRYQGAGWSSAGSGAIIGLVGDHAIGWDGRHWKLESGTGQLPTDAGGAQVHVALSMHVNLYHSYRGNTNDDDGYGLDLDVMRDTLGWLAERPEVRADWDMDNAWSTDDWMQTDGADVLAGIQARVAAGTDDVRLMSWNNGAMSAHTRAEFDESIRRAWDSNRALFAEVVPGVQPQECMFTPEHVGWYADQGIEWITLFNSATPFTALRNELELPDAAWYNPLTITDGDDSLVLVPVYHHGDLLDHGGLQGWVRALNATRQDDQLLVIHFDADAESWEAFDAELDAIRDLDFVHFTTIQDYLDDHPPVTSLPAPRDVADGTGDGLQSWAEKDFNHELATGIFQARELEAHALALAPDDMGVQALLQAAFEPRLLALSTTHFGLAAPTLHPDRIAQGRGYVADAIDGAQAALDLAAALNPVQPGIIEVREHRGSSGTALVEATLQVPVERWTDQAALQILDEAGQPVAFGIREIHRKPVDGGADTGSGDTGGGGIGGMVVGEPADTHVDVDVAFALALDALATRTLRWSVDGDAPAPGAVDGSLLAGSTGLTTAFTECDGVKATATGTDQGELWVDPRGNLASRVQERSLPVCDDAGSLTWQLEEVQGLGGVLLTVQATLPQLDEASTELLESIALSPLRCSTGADSLEWRTMGGQVLTRPARDGVHGWNGQTVDGWMRMHCTDGRVRTLSHRVTERSSLGLAPLRTRDTDAILAPLGTLWGPSPLHDAQQLGGHGMGDVITDVIGSQFRPAAADWAGKSVRYRLLLSVEGGDDLDQGTLDLFAHPPLVRVGDLAD